MEKLLGFPPLASAHGGELDSLIALVHWLMLFLFIVWGSFFVFTLIRFRAKRQPKADYAGTKSHLSTYIEIGVAAFEVVLLVGFSIPLWGKRVNAFPPEKDAVSIHVVAEQFSWNIHYPGNDGIFGQTKPEFVSSDNPLGLDRTDPAAKDDITTINQLNVPVDRPVLVRLTSKDVIHSFNLPVMRVKQDAIPGLVTPVWWKSTVADAIYRDGDVSKSGKDTFQIACAQLCGLGHYRMRGQLNVLPAADFQRWYNDEEAKLMPPPAPKDSAVAAATTK